LFWLAAKHLSSQFPDSPGLLLYEERLSENPDTGIEEISAERNRAHRLLSDLVFE
jgi:hypothetical protein